MVASQQLTAEDTGQDKVGIRQRIGDGDGVLDRRGQVGGVLLGGGVAAGTGSNIPKDRSPITLALLMACMSAKVGISLKSLLSEFPVNIAGINGRHSSFTRTSFSATLICIGVK